MGDLMRKFVAAWLCLALLVLCGCGEAPNEQATTAEPITIAETATEEPTTEEPEKEPVERPKPMWYPYTEFEEILQPGCISVNELAKRFGEPVKMTGELIANGFGEEGGNVCGLTAEFKDVTVELWDDVNGIRLSYNTKANAEDTTTYEEFSALAVPTGADRALRLELARFTVTGKEVPLPRGIRIGDSLEKVQEAYPDEDHIETEDGEHAMSICYYNKEDEEWIKKGYDPEWFYGIGYYFDDGKLARARLTWFNGWARFD